MYPTQWAGRLSLLRCCWLCVYLIEPGLRETTTFIPSLNYQLVQSWPGADRRLPAGRQLPTPTPTAALPRHEQSRRPRQGQRQARIRPISVQNKCQLTGSADSVRLARGSTSEGCCGRGPRIQGIGPQLWRAVRLCELLCCRCFAIRGV